MTVSENITIFKEVVSQAARRSVTLYFEPLVSVITAVRRLTGVVKHAVVAAKRGRGDTDPRKGGAH